MTEQNGTKAPAEKICAYEYTVKRGDSFYLIAHRLGVPLRDLLAANAQVNPARLMVGDVLCIPLEEDDKPQEEQTPAQPAPSPAEESLPQTNPEPAAPQETPQAASQGTESAANEKENGQGSADAWPDTLEEEMAEQGVGDGALDQPAAPGEGPVKDENAVCPESDRYVLKEGETLADVQLAHGLTWHTLESANPSADLTKLSAGQEICVPQENVPCELPRNVTLGAEDTLESIALKYNLSMGALLRANPCLAPADFTEGVCIALPQ